MKYLLIALSLLNLQCGTDTRKTNDISKNELNSVSGPKIFSKKKEITDSCSTDLIVEFSKRINHLTYYEIDTVLLLINPRCKNDVEFSEFTNEFIFILLERKTNLTLKVIMQDSKIDFDYFLDQIENPINDGINLKSILNNIERDNMSFSRKDSIILALETAISKMNYQ